MVTLSESQFLNYIISSKDYDIVLYNCISQDYFQTLKAEFNFIAKHYEKYAQVPDMATVLKSFPNFDVLEVTESPEYLVSELCREKNSMFLASSFNKVRELLMSGKTDEALDYYINSAQKASQVKRLEAIDILENTSRYDSYVDKCNDFGKYFLSTGFKELDDSLDGGIDRQNSYFVISARPGIGKTLIMVKFAAAAIKAGLRVGMYEGEMCVDKIAGRYDTLTSHISNAAIAHGNSSVANEYKAYLENLKNSHSGNFFVLTRDMVPDSTVTPTVLDAFITKYNLDVLYIDQISLLESTIKGKSFEQGAQLSKSLKNLQTKHKIPIIVASQQGRSPVEEGSAPGTQNLAISDRIGQDASEVIFLSKDDCILTIDIAKARDGAKKLQLKYEVDFDKGIYNYIPDDDGESIDYGKGGNTFD